MEPVNLSIQQRAARIATLLVLSPLIAEVLFGSTHLSMLYLLVPQICIYGGAALIIRALTRQRHWSAVLLLGIVFAVAEECIILQTSVSRPYQQLLFGSAPNQNYLGAFGINWTYLMWALGYESVWAIVLPVQLTELIFPVGREAAWIGRRGLFVLAVVFLVPSYGVWYTFTQVGIAPGLAYEAPLPLVLAAVGIMMILVFFALVLLPAPRAKQGSDRSVPAPWFVGSSAFLLSLPWFSLAIMPYLLPATIPTLVPVVLGIAWAALAFFLVRYWSSARKWRDEHRLALCVGALLASMLAGFLINGPALSPFDLVGKATLNVIALVLLLIFSLKNPAQGYNCEYLKIRSDPR